MENFDFHAHYRMDELQHLYPGQGAPPIDQHADKQHPFEIQPYILANQGMRNPINSLPDGQHEIFLDEQLQNHDHTPLGALLQERMQPMHASGLNEQQLSHQNARQYAAPHKTSATEVPGISHMDMNSNFALPVGGMPNEEFLPKNYSVTDTTDESRAQLSSVPQVGAGQGHPQQQKPYTPLENSAITPASVFSTVSSASTNDFLSPITSPMLQPQAGQASMFGMAENELVSQDIMNGSSPSQGPPLMNPEGVVYPQGYPSMLKGNGSRPSVTSPISPQERPHMRRARTMEKPARLRPSPLIKPVQSPKAGSSTLVWSAYKRDGNIQSPSLGAIESLSSTMQDANAFVMPSPSLSPAILALNGRGANQVPENASRSHSLDEAVSSSVVQGDKTREWSNSARASLTNSPSPIDLAHEQHGSSSAAPAMPATPGTLMGLMNTQSHAPESQESKSQQSSQSVTQPSAMAPESRPVNAVYPSTQVPLEARTSQGMGNISSYNAQEAVHAVAASAMVNAAQARSNLMYMTPQHKTILPGGLTSEDRNAWLNIRRVGHGGLDQRRTSHKAAEQKRRDSLKFCFDELRALLPAITVDDSMPSGSMLGPDGSSEDRLAEGFEAVAKSSDNERGTAPVDLTPEQAREANRAVAKVLLLRHSNEYLIRLKRRIERRDLAVQTLSEEVVRLRSLLAEATKGKSDGVDAKVSNELSTLTIEQETGKQQSVDQNDVNNLHK